MRFHRIATGVVAASAVLVGAAEADAALAPKYDRLKQFQAVLTDQVVEALGERPITRIERMKNGSFEVWGGECLVFVKLKAVPPKGGMVGPTTYEIAEVSPPACK